MTGIEPIPLSEFKVFKAKNTYYEDDFQNHYE